MEKWKEYIRQVEAYVPGEQPDYPDMVKINTNENPYPPAPGVIKVLQELDENRLRLYPNANADMLVEALADCYQVDKSKIFVGVGSDDVIAMAFLTFFNSKKPILFPNITYSFYDVWAQLYQIPFTCPKVDGDLKIQKEDYYVENGGIVIANPNAPTGICEPLEFVCDILDHNPDSVVIVDEAYIDFGGDSAMGLIDQYPNLLVVQTFSKSRSMAGMRIGFCMGNPELIQAIQRVKHSYNSYTMNLTSILAGTEALKDKTYFEETLSKIVSNRERTKDILRELGFDFPDSMANFVFAKHKTLDAKFIFEKLKEKGIFVRYFSKPIVCDYLRITIGTQEEMDRLFDALREILA